MNIIRYHKNKKDVVIFIVNDIDKIFIVAIYISYIMWIAKIRLLSDSTLLGSKSALHKVDLFVFPISFFYDKDWIIVHIAGTIIGEEESKKNFVKDLKKENRTLNFELNNDFFIGTIKEPIYLKYVYNKEIIMTSPLLISQEGYEVATIGSFKREKLTKIVKVINEKYNGKLVSLQNKKIKSISVMKIHPEITPKQKEAMHLAIKEGYYNSPRKIDLQTLAKISKLSFSTYQVHLRKAEQKLMPYFFE